MKRTIVSILTGATLLGGITGTAFAEPNLAGQVVYGNITYYNGEGKIGADGKVLSSYDCATKIGFDEPPAGTRIAVRNLDNNRLAFVYKWDRGSLPNAVLDVMPYVFSNILGQDTYYGIIHGRYFHD
ncbi:hypothetical protein DNHGIG_12860 [Collibacillus ludicampi]|jgi:ABC-type proline/glycine betaine transport system substrate-binding protein|uniref:Uncharacterized protein n=1 Tax=Collibacillus ludicampi TaxID=2771369 RepID=A0AAV4LD64_9BACL|nr:hypothetical protein [Collibacillus ludicampi]GIM45737.1 hypothetical protein DNHGIG_12860 [Collibacillus ludicampi]